MSRNGIRRSSTRSFAGLVITVALHGGIFAAIAVAHNRQEPPLIVSRDFVVAEMVKLGKPRDKFWLPRITQPQRSTAPVVNGREVPRPIARSSFLPGPVPRNSIAALLRLPP